jgi:shikimate kinase / 3-dehydroquinate synthase
MGHPVELLRVELGERGYPIVIGRNLLSIWKEFLPYFSQKRAVVVTNSVVAPLYLRTISEALTAIEVKVTPIVLRDGEQHKNWHSLNLIFDALAKDRCERKTTLIALGGGVIGDLAGFAAATYMRGMPLIQAPTTLLSQVDSSVGGKTGINHPLSKNMIGAFYQPRLVVADIATLDSLPDREFAAGMAEVIKYGLIRDPEFFEWLERNMENLMQRDPEALCFAIKRSCVNKAQVVAEDEQETGARALLNLGHTFGHAIEAGLGYGAWLHGEAVAAGTVIAARVSQRMGLIPAAAVERIRRLYAKAALPTKAPALSPERYLELMAHDKKVEAGKIRFVLLRAIGLAFVSAEVPQAVLRKALQACDD